MQLHRARFVDWTPAAVAALAATSDGCAVAVGRDDGAIELYDVASDWRCAARAPGCAGASITTLLWAEQAAARGGGGAAAPPRLFSAGLSGEIVEWDLQALRPLAATDSTGGPVWHMSARAPDDSGATQEHGARSDGAPPHRRARTDASRCSASPLRATTAVCGCSVRAWLRRLRGAA